MHADQHLLEASSRRKYSGTLPLLGTISPQGLAVPHTHLHAVIASINLRKRLEQNPMTK